MYLVDTNVLSAAAPTKAVPRQDVQTWMERNSGGLYLSVITIAEVEDGIARCRRTGAHAKANRLTGWLETVLHLYAVRILPVDIATARKIGAIADLACGARTRPRIG